MDAGGSAQAGTDGGADQPVDAGHDSGEPDTGAPECEDIPDCVCAHEREETPDDPCAAPDCPLSDCAPDDECVLKRFESSVYYVCLEERSQESSAQRCEDIDGMHLVDIGSEDEDDFLDGVVSGKVWIGATVDEDDIWSWSDGSEFFDEDGDEPIDDAYVDWNGDSAEPNGLGIGEGDVSCAILWEETGEWADTNCPAENGYVCEKEF